MTAERGTFLGSLIQHDSTYSTEKKSETRSPNLGSAEGGHPDLFQLLPICDPCFRDRGFCWQLSPTHACYRAKLDGNRKAQLPDFRPFPFGFLTTDKLHFLPFLGGEGKKMI